MTVPSAGSIRDVELTALVDRCLLLGVSGTEVSGQIRDWLAEGLGGVVLFGHNVADLDQLARLTADLHAAGSGVLVAADEEGGDVTRLHHRDGSPHPGNLALGQLDDPALTRRVAAAIGRELAAAGIDLDLAPVADVNTNPDNPIIGTRSFGADPESVGRHVAAYVQGLADAGVAGCAKHFPGHGDTDADSHLTLPSSRGDLDSHLTPFRAAIAAGVPAILTAHIVFGELDRRPATLSRPILTGLLREELGFDGVIVTDSLSMAAIASTVGISDGAVAALAAGADLLCVNADYQVHRAMRAAIVAAVVDGELPVERLVDAAGRVDRLARRRPAAIPEPETEPSRPDEFGRGLLHVDLDTSASLPLASPPFIMEAVPPRRGIEESAGSLLAAASRRDARVDGVRLYRDEVAPAPPADRPVILVVRNAHNDAGQREVIAKARSARPDTLVVGIGTSYDASLAPGHYIGTHGGARPNLAAALDLLLG